MADFLHQPVTLRTSGDREAKASLAILNQPPGAATGRAVGGMLGCWGIGALTLPIPVVHFFVPLIMFVTGIVVFFKLFSADARLGENHIPCPACETELPLSNQSFKWPHSVVCTNCGRTVDITRG